MKIINGGRRAGKTTYLVNVLKKNPKVLLIVSTYSERHFIEGWHPEVKGRVLCYADIERPGALDGRDHDSEIIVDNIESFLQKIFRYPITQVTTSESVVELNPYSIPAATK